MVRAWTCAWLAALTLALPAAQTVDAPPDIVAAVVSALRPALPYPPARPDGLPENGSADIVWSVRWPSSGESRLEVLANPLHPGNRERALEAERQIQAAALRAQQRSQGDYEQAVRDFARTGRIREIREITLRDDGVAGERYDAESQLTVDVRAVAESAITLPVTGASPPAPEAPVPAGVDALLRVHAHVFDDGQPDGVAGGGRYAPEQAWVFFGTAEVPVIAQGDGGASAISVRPGSRGRVVVVGLSGNRELLEEVLSRADWAGLARALGR